MSTRPSFFESDLLCFWIRPSHLLSQPFLFESDLLCFDPALPIFESDLPYFDSVLLIYWVSPSNFWVRPSVFWRSPHFFELDLFCFDSVLPTFFTASFPFLPLCVDLMTMCAVDKVNDGGVCRKRLLHYMERKIEIVLPENLIKKILRDKKKERKKWNYF